MNTGKETRNLLEGVLWIVALFAIILIAGLAFYYFTVVVPQTKPIERGSLPWAPEATSLRTETLTLEKDQEITLAVRGVTNVSADQPFTLIDLENTDAEMWRDGISYWEGDVVTDVILVPLSIANFFDPATVTIRANAETTLTIETAK